MWLKSPSRRWSKLRTAGGLVTACIFAACSLVGLSLSRAEPEPARERTTEKRRSDVLKLMRERAESVTVSSKAGQGKAGKDGPPAKLLAEPLLHYTQPDANILDASLWAWADTGRPIAFLKVEAHRWKSDELPQVTWVNCFASTSTELIDAKWEKGRQFRTREPGFVQGTVADGPKPAATKPARLSQMRELARKFSARVGSARNGEEMRLLATPLYRYFDSQAGVEDGTAFAITSNGTNPGLILLIELHQQGAEDGRWQFSLARLGIAAVSVSLGDDVVYDVPSTGSNPGEFPTWTWFFEKGKIPQE